MATAEMANGDIRLRIDLSALRAEAGNATQAAAQRAADRTEARVRANILTDDLVNTGGLLGSVRQEVVSSDPLHYQIAIGPASPVAKFPEHGTVAHGPVVASRLRFMPKGANRIVYAKWVRGVRAYQYMRRALDAIRPDDFEP